MAGLIHFKFGGALWVYGIYIAPSRGMCDTTHAHVRVPHFYISRMDGPIASKLHISMGIENSMTCTSNGAPYSANALANGP